MRDPFLVVPTLGNRGALFPLLENAGMPAMVIWTHPTDRPTRLIEWAWRTGVDVTVKVDRGPIDIHRWWHGGMDLAASRNLGTAVIVNDDVRAAPGQLKTLAAYVRDDIKLAYLDRPEHAKVRPTPITGWCFAVAPDASLVPEPSGCSAAYSDEPCPHHRPQLRWWYGDHVVELRAGRRRTQAVGGLDIQHLRTGWAYDRQDEVSPLIARDTAIWHEHYAERLRRFQEEQ